MPSDRLLQITIPGPGPRTCLFARTYPTLLPASTAEQRTCAPAPAKLTLGMTVDLKPETERLVKEEIRRGRFHSVDELIKQGVYALREKSNVTQAAVVPPRPRRTLYDLLTQPPFAGSQLNLERLKDCPGPVDL